ncbi:hypothetical protein V2O64_14805 [Verrucomicrobiaceae bacterium 227]
MNKNYMNPLQAIGTLGILLGVAGTAGATIIGFGGTQGSNASIDANNASWSNAIADVEGLTVLNGATPNVSVAFDNLWDYHNAIHFAVVEDHTVGGADFDSLGTDPDIAQADGREITFSVDPGFAFVLNSFDFGLSSETASQGNTWTISLSDSSSATVWSETIELSNVATGGLGDVRTLTPGFTGVSGETYLLRFNLDGELGGTTFGGGRNALDNLSFNQVVIPEVSSPVLMALAGVVLAFSRRK